ncbi:MAG: AAA family ATPase [Alphaproteobacteria bacterium]|nr:AAA family ATPase [Alphaproteobacteria bacterium]
MDRDAPHRNLVRDQTAKFSQPANSSQQTLAMMMPLTTTAFEKTLSDLVHARFPVLQVVTYEEDRALKVIVDVLSRMQHEVYVWSSTRGVVGADFQDDKRGKGLRESLTDFRAALDFCEHSVKTSKSHKAFVFLDPHPHLGPRPTDAVNRRRLRELAMNIRTRGYRATCILLSPSTDLPLELEKEVTLIDFPLPDRETITRYVEAFMERVGTSKRVTIDAHPSLVASLVDACIGLTMAEIENCLAKALVDDMTLDRSDIHFILDEKRQIIRKAGILEYIDTKDLTIQDVGGLEVLKKWLSIRRLGFTQQARDYGVSTPRGVLLTGIPGCGKSLSAKCVAGCWRMPLVKLDMGKVFSSLVGSSEENIRFALATCEAIAPCVLWIDEIEKGVAHSSGHAVGDSGVSLRVFGTLLTWMQEKKAGVFIFATSNDISALPSEFLRKGRFDEIFFVDLPDDAEREAILRIHLSKHNRNPNDYDVAKLVELSGERGFGPGISLTGAEIEAWIADAMIESYFRRVAKKDAKIDLDMGDLQAVLKRLVPIAKLRSDQFARMREWAEAHAVNASHREGAEDEHDRSGVRRLDL